MKRFIVIPLLLLCAVAGCHKADDAPAATVPGAASTSAAAGSGPMGVNGQAPPAATTTASTAATPWVSHNPQAPRDIGEFPTTGVSACDSYASVVRDCINRHTSGLERMQMRRAFGADVDKWNGTLKSGVSPTDVAKQCAAARARDRAKYHAVGCGGV